MAEYEDVLYDDYAFVEAHPARLHALARLFGVPLSDGPLRVLDVGCGLGGHLMPLAEQDSDGTYVGLDLSRPQIEAGRRTVQELGLRNVELRVADIREPPSDLGRFDIIVCHGVYSWIPDEAQRALWGLYRDHLGPRGLGYLSFNTFPGWLHRGTIRAVLQRLVPPAGAATDRERIRAAREVLQVWGSTLEGRQSHHLAGLLGEISLLGETTDAYVLYEHLAEHNAPSWFGEVLDEAAAAGLSYLGDAVLSSMFPTMPDETRAWIAARASTHEATEQVNDLFTQRFFRRSVFVHAHTAIDRELHWRRLQGLWLAARLTRKEGEPHTWVNLVGTEVQLDDPVVRAAIEALQAVSPAGLPFETVCDEALGKGASTAARKELGTAMLQLLSQSMLEVRTHFPNINHEIPERPRALPLSRLQARRREPGAVNLRHERVKLGTTDKAVLERLDGSRDRDALIAELRQTATEGDVEVRIDGELRTDEDALGTALDLVLDRLRRSAFLVG